jgi:hypothetical protein
MFCDHVKKQVFTYFTGELKNSQRQAIEEHISRCERCRLEYESFNHVWQKLTGMPDQQPSENLAVKFKTMLAGYLYGLQGSKIRPHFGFYKWLKTPFRQPAFQFGFSVALLIFGFTFGSLFSSGFKYTKITRELDDMRQIVMLSMLKQQSSADRLQAVNSSYLVERPGENIRDALQQTLETDSNINVRLAALRALVPFAHDAQVRRKIVDSFNVQTSPLVQIEIIDFIRQTETRPIELLQILEQDKNLNDVVRQHIKWTIGSLRGDTLIKEKNNANIQY